MYILIRRCYTSVGYYRAQSMVSLGKRCWTPGVAMHEMMHTLGDSNIILSFNNSYHFSILIT